MYTWNNWKDRVTQYIGRFIHSDNADGSTTHTPVPGTILEDGTPQDADHFNNMETGIQALYVATQMMLVSMHQSEGAVDEVKKELYGELGSVDMENSERYPFNNSQVSVSLENERETTNYTVDTEIVSCDGNAGEVFVTDKLVNGFKIKFTGSASNVTVKYKVMGGYAV